jgi:hypothetical protein
MNRLLMCCVMAALVSPPAADAVTHSKINSYVGKGVSISLRDPIGSVYKAGEEVGFSIRTATDAYVVVFDIDTDGFVHLLYPVDGKNFQRFSSGRGYELPSDPNESFEVGGTKGLEFVFALAVDDRGAIDNDELHFLAQNETLAKDRMFRVTGDPFIGANRIMSQLVRGISDRRDVTISFTYFYVGEAVDFPRYLCDDCYEKNKDPYSEGMPKYVASADFQKTDGLTYPLSQGFASEYAADRAPAETETQSNVTKVYVSYYPRWDDGFYDISWWYLDPWYWNVWYWDPWFTPYSGFYVGIGWNWGWWGWGACHYRYFPYYYCGPYYAWRPYWGYYNSYPDYWYGGWYGPGSRESWRTHGVVRKGQRTGPLYTAMNQRVHRDFGLAARSTKPFGPSDRRLAAATPRDAGRSLERPRDIRTTGKDEPRVIRSRVTGSPMDTRAGLSRQPRTVRSGTGKGTYREQRVITRSSKTSRSYIGDGRRTFDNRGIERQRGQLDWRLRDPGTSRTNLRPYGGRGTPENTRSYAPNTGRANRAYSPPPRSTGSSSGRSSSGRSSSSSSRGTSSGGGSRQKR